MQLTFLFIKDFLLPLNVVKECIYMMLKGKSILTLVQVLPLWGLDMETSVIIMR